MDIRGFAHLHQHTTTGSLLDGYAFVSEYAERAKKIGQDFLCISDHGMMSAIPLQIKECDNHKLEPIFAIEAYVNKHQKEAKTLEENRKIIQELSPEDQSEFKSAAHLLMIAYNQEGYKNLVRLSSWGHLHGFYRKPRVNHEQLIKHKEGIIFTSCCYNSEIGKAFEKGGKDLAEEEVKRYIEMFGKEYFYLEIMLLDFKKQKPYNIFILEMAKKHGLRTILTNDNHYSSKEDSHNQRLMLMIGTKRTIADMERAIKEDTTDDYFELQDSNLWMKSEEELNEKWETDYKDVIPYDFFIEAKSNTLKICELAKGVKLDRSLKLPQFPNAEDMLLEQVMKGVRHRGEKVRKKEYLKRIEEELDLIGRKGFASYFLITKEVCDEARRYAQEVLGIPGEYAVGKGRGSGAGSLINYLLNVTDVDPIKEDLLFSRFLSEDRGGRSINLEFSGIEPL